MTFDVARGKAAKAKHKVRVNPRNVLAWLDLSRAYTILGQQQRALAAIDCALALAPNHRHVLRAAARLFVHVGDSERAHALLAKHPKTRKDPWLLAAELAIANVAQRPPRHVRQGRALIDSDDLPPAHLTELHSAIGTLEYYHGAHRRARQSLRASLEAPTENVVAQARWMRKQLPGLPIAEEAFALPLGFEARTWRAMEEGRWDDARVECRQWLNDEPFSSRPASLGSYIGVSLTTDYSFAEACARAGLQADPNDATLQNNLTVALAYQGKLDDAIETFAASRFRPSSLCVRRHGRIAAVSIRRHRGRPRCLSSCGRARAQAKPAPRRDLLGEGRTQCRDTGGREPPRARLGP